jgi:hypothetical protein
MSPEREQESEAPVEPEAGLTDPRIVHPGTFDPLAAPAGAITEGENPAELFEGEEPAEEHPLRPVEDTELPRLEGDGP